GGCERGCNIDIYHQRGRIYRYKPRENPAVNKWWMCDEGRYSFQALQSETRLTAPLHQEKDRLIAEGWPEALRGAAGAIMEVGKANGANAIGAVIGAQSTNEEAFALKRLIKDTIGSDRLATLSWSPPGASGNDDLLIRANKNPNTRGLAALGLPHDGLDP